MRAIAEFAMRGRAYAISMSMIAAALPLMGWLSAVIVALVCLRTGVAAGFLVFLWTLMPVGFIFYVSGDPSSVVALIGTFGMSVLLRQSLSWEYVLIAGVIFSAFSALIFESIASGLLDRFVQFYIDYVSQVDASVSVDSFEARKALVGLFATSQAIFMVVVLIVARWCQSALYNPGGFRKEFHYLRLSPVASGSILLAMGLCFLINEQWGSWVPLLMVPLVFASLGLAHWLINIKSMSNNWLAGVYGSLLLLFQIACPFLASFALMDSWLDIRSRFETVQKD